jgi:hypothetical protein
MIPHLLDALCSAEHRHDWLVRVPCDRHLPAAAATAIALQTKAPPKRGKVAGWKCP